MNSTLARVPAHLRHHIVEQDYSAYDSISQAVWRFVVLHTHQRLLESAHPSYETGFLQAGMRTDRIPKISEMNDCLSRFGWGAVCVDGFIPPRAFVELQSIGILPIAADIRTSAHLAYTPAPDIIHEAAGHAPLLVNEEFASFIRQVGRAGTKAFTLPEDAVIYQAIYSLSEIKEDPASTEEQVQAAHAALDHAIAGAERVSEATKLARLYWWTAEYGLVGALDDYKLYGAGLLSSLRESYDCYSPEVKKLPLTPNCAEVSYDITRPQPQLFVVEDFSKLEQVLDPVTRDFGFRRGGNVALERAVQSEEIATVELDTGTQVSGLISQFGKVGQRPTWIQFSGRSVFYQQSEPLIWRGVPLEATDLRLLVGRILGHREASASQIRPTDLASLRDARGNIALEFESGAQLSGTVVDKLFAPGGALAVLLLSDVTLRVPERPPLLDPGVYPLTFGDPLTTFAGAAHPSYYPILAPNTHSLVPRSRQQTPTELELRALYDHAIEAWRSTSGHRIVDTFAEVHSALQQHFPNEWLLRWNLLESLVKLGYEEALSSKLEAELGALEIRFQNREPIATGLRSLLDNKRRGN